MKTTFSNNEIFHIYAQQNQKQGFGSTTQFYNNEAYSYSLKVGNIQKDYIFIYNKRYSNTTSKHISLLVRATSNYKQIYVPIPEQPQSVVNMQYFKDAIKDLEFKLVTARKKENYYNMIEKEKENADALMNALITLNIETSSEFQEIYKEISKKEIDATYLVKIQEARKKEQIKLANAKVEEIKAFRNFEIAGIYLGSEQYLRVNKETKQLETSKNVKVSLSKALYLFNMYKQFLIGAVDKNALVGAKIDYYTINAVDKKGIQIGCHYISKKELFNVLNNLEG